MSTLLNINSVLAAQYAERGARHAYAMELRDVETFLILAEELHFGRTARRLRISQGRVSQVIRALERNVGGALFDRSSRAVRLTTLGEEFRQGAERGHQVLTTTLAACKARARGVVGPVRIGYLPSIGLDFIAGLIKSVELAYPECELLFRAISLHAQPEALFTDQAFDVLLLWCPGRAAGFTVGPVLGRERRGVLVPAGHRLTQHEEINAMDLAGYPLINLDGIPEILGTQHVVVDDVMTLVLARRGLHLTCVSLLDKFPCPGLAVVPIRDVPPMVIVPVWQTAAETCAIRALIEIMSRSMRLGNGVFME